MKPLFSAVTWRRWGLLFLTFLIAIGGIIYGFGSHQVTYRKVTVPVELIQEQLKNNSDPNSPVASVILEDQGASHTFYILNVDNFSPDISKLDFTSLFPASQTVIISLVYSLYETTNVDIKIDLSTGDHKCAPSFCSSFWTV